MPPTMKSVIDKIHSAKMFSPFGFGVAVTHTVEMPNVDRMADFSHRVFELARPYARGAALVAGGLLAAAITPTPNMAALGTGGLLSAAAASNAADGPSYAVAGLVAGVAIACAHHILPYVGFGLGACAADVTMVQLAKRDALRVELAPTCAGLLRAAPAQLSAMLGLPAAAGRDAAAAAAGRPVTSPRLPAQSKTAATPPPSAAAPAGKASSLGSFGRRLAGLFAAVYAWALDLIRPGFSGSRRPAAAPFARRDGSPQAAAVATTIAASVPILPPRRAAASAAPQRAA